MLEGDTNGDNIADFAIDLTGNKTLTSADFTAGSLSVGGAGNEPPSGGAPASTAGLESAAASTPDGLIGAATQPWADSDTFTFARVQGTPLDESNLVSGFSTPEINQYQAAIQSFQYWTSAASGGLVDWSLAIGQAEHVILSTDIEHRTFLLPTDFHLLRAIAPTIFDKACVTVPGPSRHQYESQGSPEKAEPLQVSAWCVNRCAARR